MKFKDYLNSLVSRRKSNISISKPHQKSINTKNHQDSIPSADCHYDICGYEDINGIVTDDQHSRTQILLARHAELVNTIVEARSSQENPFSSCTQCRSSHQSSPMIPPPPSIPPPLPPKLSLDQHLSFSNRNYSSTLATCSPRRECHHHQQQTQQSYHHPAHLISSQYSTPNPNVMTSSSNSLWTTTASLSKKQRSKIRTNPWIGNTLTNSRQSTFIESQNLFQHEPSPPPIPALSQPEYGIYDSTLRTSPPGLIHSESFPQTTSNGNIHQINSPPPPPLVPVPAPTSSVILHQSDSGHGFSLSSSRVINSSGSSSSSSSASSSPPSSSSSPANTSGDGVLLNDKQNYRQKKLKKKISSISPPSLMKRSPKRNINTEQYFCPNTIASDSGSLTRRTKTHQVSPPVTLQYRYQRPSNMTKANSPTKSPIDRINPKHHSRSSSSRSIDDHFSLEFEEILENERSNKQRKDKQSSTKLVSPTNISSRKSPFILPLDETNIKLSSPPPPPLIFSPTLTKTNSRAILKHIEEIENEIRLIKNLDLTNDDDDDDDEYVLSPHAYPEDDIDLEDENDDADDDQNNNDPIEEIKDERQSIYEQVDQWVEKCLNTSNNTNNPSDLLHAECDHLSDTIKDYVVCVCSNDDQQTSPIPTPISPKKTTKLMTAFYLSSIPARTTKRTSSFINQPIKLENTQTGIDHLKSIHECPF